MLRLERCARVEKVGRVLSDWKQALGSEKSEECSQIRKVCWGSERAEECSEIGKVRWSQKGWESALGLEKCAEISRVL